MKQILLIMKLTTILLITVILHVSATSLAQKVTLVEKNAPLVDVFTQIRAQTGYDFLFTGSDLQNAKPVTINVKNEELRDVLTKIFQGQPLDFSIENNSVVVQEKKEPSLLDKLTNQIKAGLAQVTVQGKVTDELGNPMSGVTVREKGTDNATVTGNDGTYRIIVTDNNTIIAFSYIGYETQERKVKDIGRGLTVILKTTSKNLQEVTVNKGYYTDKKELETGDVSSVSAKEIEEQPVANPLLALEGRVPGVFIQSGQGLPGTNVTVQIRGLNSITSGNAPLYIVDGVQYPSTPLNDWSGGLSLQAANGFISPLNSINPSDIASIDVLKDADATAIYGSRGANGVILITTKKGIAGKTKLDVNLYTGMDNVTHMVPSLNTQQYLQLNREGFATDGVTPTVANDPALLLFDTTKYTNWQKYLIGNTAKVTDVQVNVSGGDQNTSFLLGGNFRDEGTVFPGDLGYYRGGAHLNVEHHSPDKKFYASITVSYLADKDNTISSTLGSYTYVPDYPLYTSTGALDFVSGNSPIAYLQQYSYSKTNNLVTNGILRYTLFPGLNFTTNLGYSSISMNSLLTYPLSSQNPSAFNYYSRADYGNNTTTTSVIEPRLDYSKTIGKGVLQALIGATWQYSLTNGYFIQGQNYTNDDLLQNLGSAGSISTQPAPQTNYIQYKYISLYSRINYNWNNKYVLNATLRRDGSSRFGPSKEFGDFGAAGFAWVFSNEQFSKSILPFLSNGKLRASYGIVGNDQIADYQYLATYSSSSSYEGVSGLQPSRIENPDYSWEIDRKLEVGIDLGFLNNRISITTSYFRNRSSNQLVGYALPSQTGFTSYEANLPALVQNTGSEFLINTVNVKAKDFSWTSSFNISFINNKLLSFPGLASSSYANTYVIGQSLSIVKGFNFVGINPQTGVPQFSTKNGTITDNPSSSTDRIVMGKTIPDFYGGLSNGFKYKGVQLDFLFQFVKQQGYEPSYWPGYTNFEPVEALKAWLSPGDITNVPRPISGNTNNAYATAYSPYVSSNRFWGDASYIRLKNLAISYNLPASWIEKLKMSQCRIYLQGQNLLTFTKYQGSDPEIPSQSYIVPTLKILSVGLQSTF